MVITEVRIKLMEDHNENERLQAFCSVTFDNAFVVRDLKIIEGAKGYFVAMPSRKLSDRCQQCGCKNHLRARFCNYCGSKLDEDRAIRDAEGRAEASRRHCSPHQLLWLWGNPERRLGFRRKRSKLPGYTCNYDDFDSEEFDGGYSQIISELNPTGRHVEHRARI